MITMELVSFIAVCFLSIGLFCMCTILVLFSYQSIQYEQQQKGNLSLSYSILTKVGFLRMFLSCSVFCLLIIHVLTDNTIIHNFCYISATFVPLFHLIFFVLRLHVTLENSVYQLSKLSLIFYTVFIIITFIIGVVYQLLYLPKIYFDTNQFERSLFFVTSELLRIILLLIISLHFTQKLLSLISNYYSINKDEYLSYDRVCIVTVEKYKRFKQFIANQNQYNEYHQNHHQRQIHTPRQQQLQQQTQNQLQKLLARSPSSRSFSFNYSSDRHNNQNNQNNENNHKKLKQKPFSMKTSLIDNCYHQQSYETSMTSMTIVENIDYSGYNVNDLSHLTHIGEVDEIENENENETGLQVSQTSRDQSQSQSQSQSRSQSQSQPQSQSQVPKLARYTTSQTSVISSLSNIQMDMITVVAKQTLLTMIDFVILTIYVTFTMVEYLNRVNVSARIENEIILLYWFLLSIQYIMTTITIWFSFKFSNKEYSKLFESCHNCCTNIVQILTIKRIQRIYDEARPNSLNNVIDRNKNNGKNNNGNSSGSIEIEQDNISNTRRKKIEDEKHDGND